MDGGNGKNGEDGKNGSKGEDGEDAGSISIEIDDPTLLLFFDFEALGGIGGKGGKGGIGGKGGKGGKVGHGGEGGNGGSSFIFEGSQSHVEYFPSGKKGKDGINGLDGKNGKDGICRKDGMNGKDGKIEILLLNNDGTIQKKLTRHYSLEINEFDIIKENDDNIEPGDNIIIKNIKIINHSEIPFPPIKIGLDETKIKFKKGIELDEIMDRVIIDKDQIIAEIKPVVIDSNEKPPSQETDIYLNLFYKGIPLSIQKSKKLKIFYPLHFTFEAPSQVKKSESYQGKLIFKNLSKKLKNFKYLIEFPSIIDYKNFKAQGSIKDLKDEIEIIVPFFIKKETLFFSPYEISIQLFSNDHLIQRYKHPLFISPYYKNVTLENNYFDALLVMSKDTKNEEFRRIQEVLDDLNLNANYIDLKVSSEMFFNGEKWRDVWRNKLIIFYIVNEQEFIDNYIGNHLISNICNQGIKYDTGILFIKSHSFESEKMDIHLFLNEYDFYDYPELCETHLVHEVTEQDIRKCIYKDLKELQSKHPSKYIHHFSYEYQPKKISLTKYLYGKGKYGILKIDKTTRMNIHILTEESNLKRDIIESLPLLNKLELIIDKKMDHKEMEIYLYIDLYSELYYSDCDLTRITYLRNLLENRKEFLNNNDVMICIWAIFIELETHSKHHLNGEKYKKFKEIKNEIKQLFFGNYEKAEGILSFFKKNKIESPRDKQSDEIQTITKTETKTLNFDKLSTHQESKHFIPKGIFSSKIKRSSLIF